MSVFVHKLLQHIIKRTMHVLCSKCPGAKARDNSKNCTKTFLFPRKSKIQLAICTPPSDKISCRVFIPPSIICVHRQKHTLVVLSMHHTIQL